MGEGSERQALADRILQQARAVQQRSARRAALFEPPVDLTLRQLRVLGLVACHPGMTGSKLGEALGVSAPTASGLIDRLAQKGLLRRTEDAADRRVRRLALTASGESVMSALESQTRRMVGALVPLLSTDELRALAAGYDVILNALERAESLEPSPTSKPRDIPTARSAG